MTETIEIPETARVGAIARLAFARSQNPQLARAEAEARVDLAAAIMLMDEAEQEPGRHSLQEQMVVELSKTAYAQALADLLRGEKA